jgi:hypothetical protein
MANHAEIISVDAQINTEDIIEGGQETVTNDQ